MKFHNEIIFHVNIRGKIRGGEQKTEKRKKSESKDCWEKMVPDMLK